MSLHTLNIRLDFPYRTGFTHGAFRPENDALASLIEPMIMVILGVLVGGRVMGMYLPIFKLAATI